jgi:outer membrane PBP1 activator LpoA protein
LHEAQKNYALNKDIYQRNDSLVNAAQALKGEQQCAKSIKILTVLRSELQDNRLNALANLIQAECHIELSNDAIDIVEQLLNTLDDKYGLDDRVYALEAKVFAHKHAWLNASKALQKTTTWQGDKNQQIWQWISQLEQVQLEEALGREFSLQPWLQLAIILKRYALQGEMFTKQIVRWQSRNTSHPLVTDLPEEISQALQLTPIKPQKIAILLPLTGRLANQGLAIKEGLLAAYIQALPQLEHSFTKNPDPERLFQQVRFFDSALKTSEELNLLVANFDVVVGPLIKEKISGLASILPAEKILLALNRIDFKPSTEIPTLTNPLLIDAELVPERYYFSLAPEDEAEQIAEHLYTKQLVRPIVFASQNLTTQRMAQAFINRWQKSPQATPPEITVFKDNKDMRSKVSEMLDVAQSKLRIRQIEQLADVDVFGVERNRRDIDSVVLFANPEQTELLNPIIEASLSPFARKSLSVFASSRSYSLDLTNNSLRDLRNLTFTDMPWMLPDHKWQKLALQTNQLWPQRQDNLLRLFAMGFDAYNLLPKLRLLKTLPQINSDGLTGKISVDGNGVLYRRLPLAQVGRDKVELLAMD